MSDHGRDNTRQGGSKVAGRQASSQAEEPLGWPGMMPGGSGRPSLPYSEIDFLNQLGARVRAARLAREMSRRELARRTGISQRYIAQIEAGKGNVSIVLLLRIAHAVRCA